MKNKIAVFFSALLLTLLNLTVNSSFAQSTAKSSHECCVMKDGKMMHHKDGNMTPMEKDMTMKNGTVCKVNGECVTKDGKTTTMKEGECMEISGKMNSANHHTKKHDKTATYSCSMHPEITSDKPGKCSKCGMALVIRK